MAQTTKGAGSRAGARTGTPGSGKAAAPPPQLKSEAEPRVCSVGFCPVAITLGVLQGAAPEATAHLIRAAQELLLAVRAVIDERLGEVGERPAEHLERIEIS
jgi:hypothetical protein